MAYTFQTNRNKMLEDKVHVINYRNQRYLLQIREKKQKEDCKNIRVIKLHPRA
jgi:uncharacterized membrane protein YobD (UPF0266 family)